MKIKIIIGLLALMISGSLKAQRIQLNEKATIQLPVNSQSITSSTIKSFAQSKNIKLIEVPDVDGKYSFVKNDMIVTFIALNKQQKVDLSKMKKGIDEMADNKENTATKIIKVNNNQFLVVENPWESKIWIYCTNSTGTALINGIIEFNEKQRSQVSNLLDSILNNIEFK